MIVNEDIYLSRKELLFYLAWILFLVTLILDQTMWTAAYPILGTILKLGRYGSYAIGMVNIFLDSFERKKFLGLMVMIGVSVLCFLSNSNMTMVLYMVFFVSAYELDGDRFLKVTVSVQAFLLAFVVLCSQIGLVEDYIFTPESRLRHGLGFSWTTTSAILFLFIAFEYIAVRKDKIKYIEILLLEGAGFILYELTNSRMAFALCSVFLLLVAFAKLLDFKFYITGFFKKLFILVPGALCALAIAIHAFYDPSSALWEKLNDFLSGRLKLGKEGIADYGISLFGTPITWVGYSAKQQVVDNYNYVDCSYLRILLEYGIIFLLIVVAIFTIVVYKSIKSENYFLLWSVVFMLILSITEPRLMNLSFNPFSILVVCQIASSLGTKEPCTTMSMKRNYGFLNINAKNNKEVAKL